LGAQNIVEKMKYYETKYGAKFSPRPMLIKMAKNNEKF
jgi:hypothetical protein